MSMMSAAPAAGLPPAPRAYRATLRAYLLPQRGRVLLLALCMLCDISLDLLGPQLQRRFLDGTQTGAPLPELLGLALVFLGIALATQALFVIANTLATDIAQRGTNRLRSDLLAHCLGLDLDFHHAHSPGELIERIDGDVALLGNFLSRFVLELLGSALLLLGALALLFRVDWRIGATMALFAAAAFVIMRAFLSRAAGLYEADREAQAALFGFLEERLAGTEEIRAAGAGAYVMRRFFERAVAVRRSRLAAVAFGSATGSSSLFLVSLGTGLSLAMGARLYREGTITIGTVYLIYAYTLLLQGPLDGLVRQLQDLQQAGAAIGRVGRLMATEGRLREAAEDALDLPEGPLSVAIEDLHFAYASGEPVLRGIDLALQAGASLGLLGRTGSGKTTLTRLLFRLADPDLGSLRLGGVELRRASEASRRRRVALVTQEVQLFHASVRDNLCLFRRGFADAQLRAAVEAVGLGPWLAGLAEGLNTVLAPGGSGLSAGQAQLLALARVLLGEPGLVVLDEASARLDPATEAALDRALARALAGRTVIVIAHRLATLRRVDAIAILEDGRVVEQGARAALAADPASRFARLLAAGQEDLDAALAESGGGA